MKRIIKNLVYDTTKAQEVGSWDNGQSVRDFSYLSETLYKKKTGEYFRHGEGGASTCYSEQVDNSSWQAGEAIVPLSYNEAREWAEEHLTADEYIAEFGAVEEEGETVQLALRISAAEKKKLERAAQKEGVSQKEVIERLIRDVL